MSFAKRRIDVTFQLGQGSFGDSGFNTVTLSGLRVRANVTKAGGVGMPSLRLSVFGMTLDQMNRLAILGKPIADMRRNVVTVAAGDVGGGSATIFNGNILESWPSFAGAPDASLEITAATAILDAYAPVPPASYQGPTDVAVVMSNLAAQMGYAFVNNGVSVILSNPYFPGTARDQVLAAAAAANINWIIDTPPTAAPPSDGPVSTGQDDSPPAQQTGNALTIWPKAGSRGGSIPLLAPSPEGAMVGYPVCTQNGIMVKNEFDPTLSFGTQFKVRSSILIANRVWTVSHVEHDLASEDPAGPWFTIVQGSVFGSEVPIVG